MGINHLIEFVSGPFDTNTGKLVCVKSPKYGRVDLCFKASMNVPFARIKLHSRDLAVDADAVLEDAYKLGCEIARRWNEAGDQTLKITEACCQIRASIQVLDLPKDHILCQALTKLTPFES